MGVRAKRDQKRANLSFLCQAQASLYPFGGTMVTEPLIPLLPYGGPSLEEGLQYRAKKKVLLSLEGIIFFLPLSFFFFFLVTGNCLLKSSNLKRINHTKQKSLSL